MDKRDIDAAIELVHQAALSGIDKTNDKEDWRNHPLFRTELPDDVDNDYYLGAFQSLMYEDATPDKLAEHYKELGNEMYKAGNKKGADQWWNIALDQKPSDMKLRSIIHCNKAQSALSTQQYQRAVWDAEMAIKYDNFNKKAYLRAAFAYCGMANWDKAIEVVNACLEIVDDKTDSEMYKGLMDCKNRSIIEIENGKKRSAQYINSLVSCDKFFKEEKMSVGGFAYNWQANWDLLLRYNEDKKETIWPMLLVYNEVLQVDFVESISETLPLIDIMHMVLPGKDNNVESPKWDLDVRYTIESMLLYVLLNEVEAKWGRITKGGEKQHVMIDPNISLRQLLSIQNYVVPGYPIVYIAVKGSDFAGGLGIKKIVTASGILREIAEDDIKAPPPKESFYAKHLRNLREEMEAQRNAKILPIGVQKTVSDEK